MNGRSRLPPGTGWGAWYTPPRLVGALVATAFAHVGHVPLPRCSTRPAAAARCSSRRRAAPPRARRGGRAGPPAWHRRRPRRDPGVPACPEARRPRGSRRRCPLRSHRHRRRPARARRRDALRRGARQPAVRLPCRSRGPAPRRRPLRGAVGAVRLVRALALVPCGLRREVACPVASGRGARAPGAGGGARGLRRGARAPRGGRRARRGPPVGRGRVRRADPGAHVRRRPGASRRDPAGRRGGPRATVLAPGAPWVRRSPPLPEGRLACAAPVRALVLDHHAALGEYFRIRPAATDERVPFVLRQTARWSAPGRAPPTFATRCSRSCRPTTAATCGSSSASATRGSSARSFTPCMPTPGSARSPR